MVNRETLDLAQFVKNINTTFPAPTSNAVSIWFFAAPHASVSSHPTSHPDVFTVTRITDSVWRSLTVSDIVAKEGGKSGANNISGDCTNVSSTAAATQYPNITVGRMMVTTEDRWRIQAQMRRQEAKSGQTRKEYNKKVTRAIKATKGPQPEGFTPGRGRPI